MSGIVGTSHSKSKIIGKTIDTAQAWINFNGTGTVAIRDSFNCSSITDNNTGNYWVNFETNMKTETYAVAGMGIDIYYGTMLYFGDSSITNTEVGRVCVATSRPGGSHSGAAADNSMITVIVMGN